MINAFRAARIFLDLRSKGFQFALICDDGSTFRCSVNRKGNPQFVTEKGKSATIVVRKALERANKELSNVKVYGNHTGTEEDTVG